MRRTSEGIVFPFKVDRTKTPAEMLACCGRILVRVDEKFLATMPVDGPEEGELVFFQPAFGSAFNVESSEIPEIFAKKGLVPDYLAQIQVNADNPAFADKCPNEMQWEYVRGIYFSRHDARGGRIVQVGRMDSYIGQVWFAGRHK